jgi:hypothetical protein
MQHGLNLGTRSRTPKASLRGLGLVGCALILSAASSPTADPLVDGSLLPVASTAVPAEVPLQWPRSHTPAPSSEQWRAATPVQPTRAIGTNATQCRVRRVEEWVSIRCAGTKVSAMTQLAGNVTGVSFHLDPPGADRLPTEGVLVFPLRPGDRRAFTVWTLGDGYDGPLTVVAGIVVQTEWTGEVPTLLLHDALVEPVKTRQSALRRLAASPR